MRRERLVEGGVSDGASRDPGTPDGRRLLGRACVVCIECFWDMSCGGMSNRIFIIESIESSEFEGDGAKPKKLSKQR